MGPHAVALLCGCPEPALHPYVPSLSPSFLADLAMKTLCVTVYDAGYLWGFLSGAASQGLDVQKEGQGETFSKCFPARLSSEDQRIWTPGGPGAAGSSH